MICVCVCVSVLVRIEIIFVYIINVYYITYIMYIYLTSRAPFSTTLMKYHSCCFSNGPKYPTSKLGVELEPG